MILFNLIIIVTVIIVIIEDIDITRRCLQDIAQDSLHGAGTK